MTADQAAPPIAGLPTRDLLRLYAQILTELLRRGVVWSRNAPWRSSRMAVDAYRRTKGQRRP